jgi:plasmid stability protein
MPWDHKMQRLKIALPEELRAQLDAASAKSGRSVADEIRRRVEASFAHEAVDKPTRDFVDGIALMPAEIERETGGVWHKHADAWDYFRRWIERRLIKMEPPQVSTAPRAQPHPTTANRDPEHLIGWWEIQLGFDPGYTTSERRRTYEEMFQKDQQEKKKGKKS